MSKWILGFSVSFLLVVLIISCEKTTPNDGNPASPTPTGRIAVTGIGVLPQNAVMKANTTLQCTATIDPANASNPAVTWSSSDNAVATVNATGLVTALHQGDVSIIAKSTENPAISATCQVHVLKDYNVYLAGNGGSAVQGYTVDILACCWKNKSTVSSLNGGHDGGRSAKAITSDGTNTYVAGLTVNPNFWFVPTLWVNNTPVLLRAATNNFHHFANSIATSGSDVYVAGYSYNNIAGVGVYAASLWRVTAGTTVSTLPLPLSNGMTNSEAYSVATSSTDVYTSGSISNNSVSLGCYWKNSTTPVILTGATNYGKAKGIVVSGSDVYVAGYEGCPNYGCTVTCKIWKNGSPVTLGTYPIAEVTGMSVSGSDVYVSGRIATYPSEINTAMLWKISGNTVTSIPLTNGTVSTIATGVSAINNDIFLSGYETINGLSKGWTWRVYNNTVVEAQQVYYPNYAIPTSWSFWGNMSRMYGIYVR